MAQEMKSILEHLQELRKTIIISLSSIIIASVGAYILRDKILGLLVKPLNDLGYKLVFLTPTEAFFAKIKLSLMTGAIVALPVILYALWAFIMPALYEHERKSFGLFLPLALTLFAAGVVFCYEVVFPLGMRALLVLGGEGLTPMMSIGSYVSFCFWFLMPFGLIFEMPLIIGFLARIGLVSAAFLARKRKYIFLIIVFAAALLTPGPDVITQLFLAGPMYLLFEISILIARRIPARKEKEEDTPVTESM